MALITSGLCARQLTTLNLIVAVILFAFFELSEGDAGQNADFVKVRDPTAWTIFPTRRP